jgi:hypothetical protein
MIFVKVKQLFVLILYFATFNFRDGQVPPDE